MREIKQINLLFKAWWALQRHEKDNFGMEILKNFEKQIVNHSLI